MRRMTFIKLAWAMLIGLPVLCWASGPVDIYQFDSDEEHRRYELLIEEFRCPKCLYTNSAGSDAPIAQDLRRTVHRLVVQDGLTDQEVRDFLQARYGDFVLYNPPFSARTYVIWLMPGLLAVLAIFVLISLLRRARSRRGLILDDAAEAQLKAILKEE